MDKKFFLMVLWFACFSLNAIIEVDDSYQPPIPGWGVTKFDNIQDAVDAYPQGEVIYIHAGTYQDDDNASGVVVLTALSTADVEYTLVGDDPTNTIIDGENERRCLNIHGYHIPPSDWRVTVHLINLKIQNGAADSGAGILGGNRNTISIDNCIIVNNAATSNGGGIYTYNNGVCGENLLSIENSEIAFNDATSGGGVYFLYGMNGHSTLTILNTVFKENDATGGIGGGIYTECCVLDFSNLLFIGNSVTGTGVNGKGGAIYCTDWGTDCLTNSLYGSLFAQNSATTSGGAIYFSTAPYGTLIELTNLTISDNTSANGTGGIVFDSQLDQIMEVVNCIIFDNDGQDQIDNTGNGDVEISYSCIENGDTTNGNINIDPQFTNISDYSLEDNSPCIDAGDPAFDLDPDGTICDMGYLTARDHEIWYFDESEGATAVWNWQGFPRLDTDEENEGQFVEGVDLMEKIEYPDRPDGIYTWYQNSDATPNFLGDWNNITLVYEWEPDPENDLFNSTRGYKIRVYDTLEEQSILKVFGDVIDPTTEMEVDVSLPETWVCYFRPETQNFLDALDSTTRGNLVKIHTKNWSAVKFKNTWNLPANATISYGELVILQPDPNLTEDFNFTWQPAGRDVIEPYVRPVPTQFNYSEELDYFPIYMEFGEELPLEVGVYVDGVCRGAEVVDTDSLFHLRAFVLDEPAGIGLEFVFYNGRSEMEKREYRVLEEYEQGNGTKLTTGNLGEYAFITFGEPLKEDVPEVATELCAYPNPFNPTISISFQIAEDSVVNLDIFNMKGQKVKTLISSEAYNKGDMINKVWNGNDELGKAVSGGIYFIRLQTADEIQTRKVVMLK